MKYHDYEDAYSNTDEYYWGIAPSQMCLKVISLMPPDKHLKLLDIGCGEGKDAVFFARCGYEVSAFDVSAAGIEKVKRLAAKANVSVNAYTADILSYRLDNNYDILYSSGALHYIKPELCDEIIDNYQIHTNMKGLHAFNVFVEKPFIALPPEHEEHSCFWRSGQLLTYYADWFIEYFTESVFDCDSSGIPHRHAMNTLHARMV